MIMKTGNESVRPALRRVGIVVLLAGLLGLGAWQGFDGLKKKDGPAVETAAVETGAIEDTVTAQGKLEPKEYVDVGAQVSGQIQKLHIDIGDNVKSGDLIAEIDPEIYESRVRADEARLKTLEAQKSEQQANIDQAQLKVDRNEKLVKSKAVSQEAYDDSKTALKIALAKLQSISAQIEEAQSALEGDKANLNYTKIFAPMDGTVVSLTAREGETLNANQTTPTIAQLADLDTMTVRAQVAEADVTRLTPDMPVYFTTLGAGPRRWNARVRQILPSPETVNDVVLYNVLIDVGNEDRQLMTGMTTQIFFEVGKADKALLIPVSALLARQADSDTDAGQAYKVKILEGGAQTEKTIHVGIVTRAQAQVTQGLKEGDLVVLPTPVAAKPSSAPSSARMPRL